METMTIDELRDRRDTLAIAYIKASTYSNARPVAAHWLRREYMNYQRRVNALIANDRHMRIVREAGMATTPPAPVADERSAATKQAERLAAETRALDRDESGPARQEATL